MLVHNKLKSSSDHACMHKLQDEVSKLKIMVGWLLGDLEHTNFYHFDAESFSKRKMVKYDDE